VGAVLRAAEGLRYRPVLVLIAATGLCRGEALALRWDRVDLTNGALKVKATLGRIGDELVITEPKSPRSRRTVPLSPADVLGHSGISITGDIYRHGSDATTRAAVERLSRTLRL
jgi:integrase